MWHLSWKSIFKNNNLTNVFVSRVKHELFSFLYHKYLLSDAHMEELDSVQKFTEIQGWLILTFFICLHNQLSSFNSIIVQVSEKHDSSSGQ